MRRPPASDSMLGRRGDDRRCVARRRLPASMHVTGGHRWGRRPGAGPGSALLCCCGCCCCCCCCCSSRLPQRARAFLLKFNRNPFCVAFHPQMRARAHTPALPSVALARSPDCPPTRRRPPVRPPVRPLVRPPVCPPVRPPARQSARPPVSPTVRLTA